jgi:hypothetical protein
VVCFLGVDFAYYWFYRLSHEVNFLWAGRVVHHQSEEFNLSVALRQSTLQPIFGTFEREAEEVVHGITTPLESWNPVWANLHYWVELFRTALATRRPIDKFRTFVASPGWYPEDRGGVVSPPSVSSLTTKFDRAYPQILSGYAIFQFGLLVVLTIGLGSVGGSIGLAAKLAGVTLVVWGLVNIGGLFDGRPWSFASEAGRVVMAPLLPLLFLTGGLAWAIAATLTLGTAAFALRLFGLRESSVEDTTSTMNVESI